jgi:hypothetical protein
MFAFASDGAPRPVLPALDEARAYRVVEDVVKRVPVMLFVADDPGGEPLTEERSLATEPGVVLPGVVALDPLHGRREVFDPGVDECVVVRPHQAEGVEPESPTLRALHEEHDECPIVVPVAEQPGFVDGVRGQVEVAVWQLGADYSGHAIDRTAPRSAHRPPCRFLSTFDTPSRATASVRHSPWPKGPRRYSARRSTKR